MRWLYSQPSNQISHPAEPLEWGRQIELREYLYVKGINALEDKLDVKIQWTIISTIILTIIWNNIYEHLYRNQNEDLLNISYFVGTLRWIFKNHKKLFKEHWNEQSYEHLYDHLEHFYEHLYKTWTMASLESF